MDNSECSHHVDNRENVTGTGDADLSELRLVDDTAEQEESTEVCASKEADGTTTISDINLDATMEAGNAHEVVQRHMVQHDAAENPRMSLPVRETLDQDDKQKTSSYTNAERKDEESEKVLPRDSDGGMTSDHAAAATSHVGETELPSRSADDVSQFQDTFGTDIKDLPAVRSDAQLPPLREDENCVVLFDIEDHKEHPDQVPDPCPCSPGKCKRYTWDRNYVRMQYTADNWQKITTVLNQLNDHIQSLKVVGDAIKRYNDYPEYIDFLGLEEYFCKKDADGGDTLLSRTCLLDLIPKIAKLATDLPNVCTRPIPLLRRQQNFTVALSQYQVACLLANAFFCTFPSNPALYELVDVNFTGLLQQPFYGHSDCHRAKLDCIFNYFLRITTNMPTGIITFRRQVS